MAWLMSVFEAIANWSVSDKIAFVNCIFTGFFLLATIVSAICAFKAYKHQKDRSRKEAACSLARYYAENIIMRHSFVLTVLNFAEVESQAKDLFPYKELFRFDRSEMLTFLNKAGMEYDVAQNIFLNIDPQAILNAKLSYVTSIQEKQCMAREYIVDDKENDGKKLIFTHELQQEFLDKICEFLNDLEWFSMSCRYGISDEEILYQSLHTTFLLTISVLYFYICDKNYTNEDKLFTNIMWLFDKWRDRLVNILDCAEKEQAKAEKKVKAAERKCIVAERELNKIEPKVHSGKALKK